MDLKSSMTGQGRGANRIHLAQDRKKFQSFVNTVMNTGVP